MIEYDIEHTLITAGDQPTSILWGRQISKGAAKEVVRAPRLHEVDSSHVYRKRKAP